MADVDLTKLGVKSEAEFEKLFASFMKQRVSTAARDKATRAAQKELIEKHRADYDTILAKHMKAAGV